MNALFVNGKIGSMELTNKFIMTAMHTGYSVEEETEFLKKRVAGGAAAVTTVMGVSNIGAFKNMCVLDETVVEQLNKMAESIHNESGRLIVQLFHAGRNASVGMLVDSNALPVAPSQIPSPIYKTIPREMTIEEIVCTVKDFGNAAMICKRAGVDAVEISCSAGYLLSEFLSPLTNKREDEYGGTFEKNLKFPIEVVQEVRKKVGVDYPVILRVSASDMLGGYGINETIEFIMKVESCIDAVNVTGGWHESEIPQISMYLPEGGFAFLARAIKQKVKVPIIACNRINNENTATEIIENGYADYVGCARPFLIDSDFVKKIMLGIPYRRCIGCNKGCIEKVLKLQRATCIFNPELERTSSNIQKTVFYRRRILIVGGGPAGMEAALKYSKEGNEVQLCTDQDKLGGLMHFAAKPPYKETITSNILSMTYELENTGVNICYGTVVDGNYIERYKPDIVVVASGSKPFIPAIKGVRQGHVYTAQDILEADNKLINNILKKQITIIGGGSVGLETALYLTRKQRLMMDGNKFFSNYFYNSNIRENIKCDSNITIIEMGTKLGKDLGGLRYWMLNQLKEFNIATMINTKVDEILKDRIVLNNDESRILLDSDCVILAVGYESQGLSLINWLKSSGKYQFQVVGDAKQIGNIGMAISDAYEIVNFD